LITAHEVVLDQIADPHAGIHLFETGPHQALYRNILLRPSKTEKDIFL
jgi:hypothetical protein